MKRTGIFGGTFDPVHTGHVELAKDALEQAGLDRVIFVPARLQPFKLDRKTASGTDRMEMLKLALEGYDGMEASPYELESESISYTYLTMRAMSERFGDDIRLFFITGTDTFLKIEMWKNSYELLTKYSYIIGARPGYRETELQDRIMTLKERYGTEVLTIDNTQHDISSTEIRDILRSGGTLEGLVPERVERYIRKHGIYT